MARMFCLAIAIAVPQQASAAWKHRQLFQPEAPPAVRVADIDMPAAVEDVAAGWEVHFKEGLSQSRAAATAEGASGLGRWVVERSQSGAVPADMLESERLMAESLARAPDSIAKDQMSVFATRLYYHAKWLAERQHAAVAEERYRRSKDLALQVSNEDLASHALSRLGYFLRIWGRPDEARQVLKEAVALQAKPNNVASFLLGALERKEATCSGDAASLLEADERILASQKVPSKDLEDERLRLISEIRYWQDAESSPMKCLESDNMVHSMICGAVHIAKLVEHFFA
jgi:hypothetical protein